jgi:hypothetical protein
VSNDNGLTLTIKYGKGFEESWIVIRGEDANDLKERVIDYFGFDGAALESMTANELATLATAKAHGMANAARTLSAVSIPSSVTVETAQPAAQAAEADPWADDEPAGQSEPADPNKPALDAIEAAASVDDLKAVYADFQASWNDVLLAAYKTKGRSLPKAAA